MEETMGARRNSFIAIHPSRTNDTYRGLCVFHDAGLYRGGMGAQQHVGRTLNEECVLHVPGRVVFGKVQCREYVPVVFDFGPFGNGESQASENIANFVPYQRNGVAGSQWYGVSRASKIYGIVGLGFFVQCLT